ncbi:MAG: hypothetical protein M3340_12085 [Actinomycetota bacterium]|nr:hypothetical protein [Actinomycetota bacterium]
MKKYLAALIAAGAVAAVAASASSGSTQSKASAAQAGDKVTAAARGPRGKRGPVGPQGPHGPQGPPGPVDLGRITAVEGPEVRLGPNGLGNDIQDSTAQCPTGQRVLSGGYTTITGDAETFSSRSYSDSSWSALADNESSTEGYVQAFAFCAPAGKAVMAKTDPGVRERRIERDIERRRAG